MWRHLWVSKTAQTIEMQEEQQNFIKNDGRGAVI